MTELHPIDPPPKLVGDWLSEAGELHLLIPANLDYLATRAAQWGADQEREAIEHWLITGPYGASIACAAQNLIADLRAARRPKPPSLKEQALKLLAKTNEPIMVGTPMYRFNEADADTLRRAIEALPDE